MVQALITVGSNVDKERNVADGLAAMRAHPQWRVLAVSRIYETPALDRDGHPSGQASFHNSALLVETELTAEELRSALRRIEAEHGRVRTADKYAARTLDLDIALYGGELRREDSTLPDPDILRRAHVAIPLADIAPHWVHPTNGATLAQIADTFTGSHLERIEQ